MNKKTSLQSNSYSKPSVRTGCHFSSISTRVILCIVVSWINNTSMSQAASFQDDATLNASWLQLAHLDTKMVNISALIIKETDAHKITAAEADNFKIELKRLSDLKNLYSLNHSLNYADLQSLFTSLNNLESNIRASAEINDTKKTTIPLINQELTTTYPTNNSWLDNKVVHMENQLNSAREHGRLNGVNYAALRSQLDSIVADANTYRNSYGKFTAASRKQLRNRLNDLNNSINNKTSHRYIAYPHHHLH